MKGKGEKSSASLLYKSKSFGRRSTGKRRVYRKTDSHEFANDRLFLFNYSDSKDWQTAISRVALSQRDYPEGVGVKVSMDCMERAVRDRKSREMGYVYCSPKDIKVALGFMAREYNIIKKTKERGRQ